MELQRSKSIGIGINSIYELNGEPFFVNGFSPIQTEDGLDYILYWVLDSGEMRTTMLSKVKYLQDVEIIKVESEWSKHYLEYKISDDIHLLNTKWDGDFIDFKFIVPTEDGTQDIYFYYDRNGFNLNMVQGLMNVLAKKHLNKQALITKFEHKFTDFVTVDVVPNAYYLTNSGEVIRVELVEPVVGENGITFIAGDNTRGLRHDVSELVRIPISKDFIESSFLEYEKLSENVYKFNPSVPDEKPEYCYYMTIEFFEDGTNEIKWFVPDTYPNFDLESKQFDYIDELQALLNSYYYLEFIDYVK